MKEPKARVLIVDDHQELVENIIDILGTRVGNVELECVASRSRKEAIDVATTGSFDLALVDLHLPDGHGLELLGSLRSSQPFLQGVVITGDVTIESAIGALQEGAFAYVLKPFNAQQLLQTCSKAIDRARLLREREELRRKVETSERFGRDVIDGVPAFVVALDEAGIIVLWNRTLQEVTGYKPEEMIGQPGSHLVDSGEPRRLPLKGGGHRTVRWRQAALSRAALSQATEGQQLVYAVGVDVTEELEMQRRAALAERLAAVGTMAAGLAHEVRNPLNSATLQLQLLERRIAKGKLEPQALTSVVTIVKDEIERLDNLVHDFLAFAKPQPLTLQATDLCELVASVAQLLRVEAERAHVELSTELAPDLGLVPIEPQRMKQVVINLARNAIQATPGGGKVTLRTKPSQTTASVELEVEDTGTGFPTDAPIFDAFYTTKDGGTGLGLALVHTVVTEHGGSVAVSSRAGRTRFCVLLPQPESASGTNDKVWR